jgi:aldehyde:ferredoxin oxidoreductase
MDYGYAGKLLFINLGTQEVEVKELDDETCRKFIGGSGLGAKILFENMVQGADVFGPENILGFVTGPFTATGVPGGGRYTVVTKSPVTGGWGEANSGGFWGPELKKCGFDAVFISGIASKPTYISIKDHRVVIRNADHLWGKDTNETSDLIQDELNEQQVKVACIGPAGESLSLMSGIVNEKGRIAARGGVGAVMGSKRLKAIAVLSTKQSKTPVAEPELFKLALKDYTRKVKENPFNQGLSTGGTGGGTSHLLSIGDCPSKNWNSTGTDSMETCYKLNSANMEKYKIKKYGCQACVIRCGAILKVNEGPFATSGEIHRPEHETSAAFGTLCLNDNVEAVIKINEICNLYGIDTIAMGGVMAFAIECFENGIITLKDTDGLELKWSDGDGLVALAQKIAERDNLGKVLSDGVKAASQRIGKNSEKFAMHVGGHRISYHDPRLSPSLATQYISDPQPGHHMGSQGSTLLDIGVDLSEHPALKSPKLSLHDYDKKGPSYVAGSAYFQLLNSGGLCALYTIASVIPIMELLVPITGWDMDWDEGLKTGKRILSLRQAFNVREGVKPNDFKLPKRFQTPLKVGPGAGKKIDFELLKESFFNEMGWDLKTVWPSKATLKELQIDKIVNL